MKNKLKIAMIEEINNFIDNELCYDSVKNNQDGVLDYLNSLTKEDKNNIAENIISDDYFWDIMNEILNANIYHYRKWHWYIIKELATGITMVESEDLDEIKEIYKNYDRKYFVLQDNTGKEVK